MKKLLRILCFTLSLCMVFCLLAACADNTPDTPDKPDDTDPEKPDDPDDEDTRPDYLLTLPQKDYEDAPFNILCRTDKEYEVFSEEPDGTLISKAVFGRNSRIEEYYHVSIESSPVDGNWGAQSTFIGALKTSVGSGDDAYQMVAGYMAYITDLATDGNFLNLQNIDTLDFTKPWYSQSFIENCTIRDHLFFAQGDLSLTMWEGLYAIFFNKEMARSNGINDLYDLVRNGDWTLEELETISEQIYLDDGNDIPDNADTYGLLINSHSLRSLITTCDIPIVSRDDDEYEIVYYSDKVVDLYSEMYSFLYNKQGVFFSQPTDDADYTEMLHMFQGNQGLFMTSTLDNASTLRNMETDFGILPFPKYDDDQETYLSHSYDGQSVFSIPSSVQNPEFAACIMDAMGAESCYSVIPAYYEDMLMDRVTRDNESREVLDTIRKNLYYDTGFIYAVPIGGLFQVFGDQLKANAASITSYYESHASGYETKLEELVEKYENLTD